MEKRRLLFIFSLLAIFTCYGQDPALKIARDTIPPTQTFLLNDSTITTDGERSDSVETPLPKRFLIPSLYLDYGKLLTIPVSFETKYEGGVELLFGERFTIIGELGSATLSPRGAYTNGTYESDGIYYRLGLGYLMQKDAEHHIGISMRYGSASFDELVRIFIESTSGAQDDVSQTINRSSLAAKWWELILYTDQQLFRKSERFWVGLNVRLRILQSYDQQEEIDVYAIPGYGRSFDKTIPAANIFLKVRF